MFGICSALKRLADFHLYDEADAVRRRIQRREIEERDQVVEKKREKVEKCVHRKEELFEEERRSFRAKMRNEIALARFRASQEEQRIHNMYDHLQRDISHSQHRESQVNPLLAVYNKPRFARSASQRPTTSSSASKPRPPTRGGKSASAGHTTCSTGTTYFRKMLGSRFELPSLCDMYGHTLEPGHDPAAPVAPRLDAVPQPPLRFGNSKSTLTAVEEPDEDAYDLTSATIVS